MKTNTFWRNIDSTDTAAEDKLRLRNDFKHRNTREKNKNKLLMLTFGFLKCTEQFGFIKTVAFFAFKCILQKNVLRQFSRT